MLKKIIRKIKLFWSSLFIGMKHADETLTTSNKETAEGMSIQQNIEHKNVYADLLRGEVTQEVEELRWEMYKADELANDYKYVGNGQAIKIEDSEIKKANRRLKFTQWNIDITYGLHESLKMAHEGRDNTKMDYTTRKLFMITYDNPCVRFKLENYIDKISVNLKNGIKVSLYFTNNKHFKKIVPLINEIKRVKNELELYKANNNSIIKTFIEKTEILSSMKELEFTTFNATNNVPNGILYKFKNPSIESITEKSDNIVMTFNWESYEGGELLSEKFACESAEKKYGKV